MSTAPKIPAITHVSRLNGNHFFFDPFQTYDFIDIQDQGEESPMMDLDGLDYLAQFCILSAAQREQYERAFRSAADGDMGNKQLTLEQVRP
jgi:hypothetical protein